MRVWPIVVLLATLPWAPAGAQVKPPAGDDASQPIAVQAREIRARPDLDVVAEGAAELQRGGVRISADRLSYELADDLAVARGAVRIEHQGARFAGPELSLRVQRFEGSFEQPSYDFTRTGAGGSAARIDFIDSARANAIAANYTSCPRDAGTDPAWLLATDSLRLDFDADVGVAEGAVLRFLGVPILAAPVLSFPLSDKRKSGWLPPTLTIDSRSGLVLAVPYYWNIAPDRDATLVPKVLTRRGAGLDGEFRYLDPDDSGRVGFDLLPVDHVAGHSRHGLTLLHEGQGPGDVHYGVDLVRVSDDDWWKDFPGSYPDPVQRLLPLRAHVERSFAFGAGEGAGTGLLYARAMRWQVLQSSVAAEKIESPYERSPQLGASASGRMSIGRADDLLYGLLSRLDWHFETEANRFTLPANDDASGSARPTGSRLHAQGSIARPWREPGWWLVPRLAFNSAHYATDRPMTDGRREASRTIPTFSLDAGLEFERPTRALGRELRQTLEPRLLYVNTPYRDQSGLPAFDAWGRDFNSVSLYAENSFSGIDRVSDSHQIAAGLTTRLLDRQSGAEALRLGVVQRYLLRDQKVTAQDDGTPDGAPLDKRFSDVLLVGSTNVLPAWTLDAALQYSPDIARTKRSILSARYSPGPFRTVSATYRLARGVSEQVELGWQWPLSLPGSDTPAAQAARHADTAPRAPSAGACSGAWYGVGRLNYSLQDVRLTDAIVGFEYDAGCWIGRVVAERLSTGTSEATTRLLLQLELIGLSRLGSNPLQVLKDNIPGYRLLREERGDSPSLPSYD